MKDKISTFNYWRRRHNLLYEAGKRLDRLCLNVAHRAPARLRLWFVVDSTNAARVLYPDPSGYAGPDGLGYTEIYDGARRTADRSQPTDCFG